MNSKMMIGSLLGAAAMASAHLGALTEPKAGNTYQVGATVNVKWSIVTEHNAIDLSYSQDGKTWVPITNGLGSAVTTFAWTVPDKPSTTTRFRVCQRDGKTATGCTDAHNTQDLSAGKLVTDGKVYTAIAGNFIITGGTSVASAAQDAGMLGLSFDAASRNVRVSFRMDQAGPVLLEAFDTQGRLLAVLLNEQAAAGNYVRSTPSDHLPAGALVLRLQAGSWATQQTVGTGR